jgi:hypothetical protein
MAEDKVVVKEKTRAELETEFKYACWACGLGPEQVKTLFRAWWALEG